MSSKQRIEDVLNAVREADGQGLSVKPPEGVLSGFSGEKLTGMLQRLAGLPTGSDATSYLEIGVFQGMTLLSTALANPSVQCTGIDNFAFFDTKGVNEGLVHSRAKELGVTNFDIINSDFEEALNVHLAARGAEQKISTYFIDGPHDYRSQLVCLLFALPHLMDGAAIVIDDCNYPHVRQATFDFLTIRPDFKLLFEAYTPCHPLNMTAEQTTSARDGWWDGVQVLVHDPDDHVVSSMPPIPATKDLFYEDHVVQTMAYAPVATDCVNVVQAFARPWRLPKAVIRYAGNASRAKGRFGEFQVANTFSDGLTAGRFADLKK